MSIRQKIAFGYALAFSVGTGGTLTGLLVADAHHAEVSYKLALISREGRQLDSLYQSVSQARLHQQAFSSLLTSPKTFRREHEHFLSFISQTKAQFATLQEMSATAQVQAIKPFVQSYRTAIEDFFTRAELLIGHNNPEALQPEQIPAAQQQLLAFVDDAAAETFDNFTTELANLAIQSNQLEASATEARNQADQLRIEMIVGSLLLSGVLAACLAFCISRSMTRPIQKLTQIANTVVQDQNFDLQASVNRLDEIGVLAAAFNQLVQWIAQYTRDLNNAQQATQQQFEELKQAHRQLNRTMYELKQAQLQLIQSEKMSSLGQLVAGVAHEINNPVNFIHGNLLPASEYVRDILHLLQLYQQHFPSPPQAITDETAAIDLDFISEDLMKVLASMQVGTNRIRQIVLSLRNFARMDEAEMKAVNIHDGLDSTLMILENRLKAKGGRSAIEVTKSYGDLPLVECYAGQLNQVFMNILVNAIDALEERDLQRGFAASLQTPSRICISTGSIDDHQVLIRIADNGPGMSQETQRQLFDPFFTTKPAGKGTGMGMSISYQIVEKHGGTLQCFSTPEQGTEFLIQIPLSQLGSRA